MSPAMLISLFLPLGVLFFLNPGNWADRFKTELAEYGMHRSLTTAIAAGWVIAGTVGLLMLIS